MTKVVGVVGSYRKKGIISQAVSEVLEAAKAKGAETKLIDLLDQDIQFCKNCRGCTQEGGEKRGKCVIEDDLDGVLTEIDSADYLVLGSPVNFFNLTALMRRFMERLVCYTYWPWDSKKFPVLRTKKKDKQAVLITSSAMPAIIGRFMTGSLRALRIVADTVGAKSMKSLFIGLVAVQEQETLPEKIRRKARKIGSRLV